MTEQQSRQDGKHRQEDAYQGSETQGSAGTKTSHIVHLGGRGLGNDEDKRTRDKVVNTEVMNEEQLVSENAMMSVS